MQYTDYTALNSTIEQWTKYNNLSLYGMFLTCFALYMAIFRLVKNAHL